MKSPALKVSLLYLFTGAVWILISDRVVNLLPHDDMSILLIQNIKGIFYVFITSVILYLMVKKFYEQQISSQKEYERLFLENPNCMWIYDKEDLSIIAVNKAALEKYQYSRDEFLNLKVTDLRPEKERIKFLREIQQTSSGFKYSGIWVHRKKNSEVFYCQVYGHSTVFKKRKARLVLSLDINDQVLAEKKILEQNQKLREIAHMQAHDLRGPLASIMGLISIFDRKCKDYELNLRILHSMEELSLKLDQKIRQIVRTTEDT